jgi:hypothetical protein
LDGLSVFTTSFLKPLSLVEPAQAIGRSVDRKPGAGEEVNARMKVNTDRVVPVESIGKGN